jgi:HSP20 family protein
MNLLSKWSPFREEESGWTTPARWSPFRELERMQRRMEGLFGSTLMRGNGGHKEAITATEWEPLVDVTEDDKEYLITAELPELKKENVRVTVENGVLTLSGERKFEKEERNKKYHRLERAYGSFMRSFSLPDDADAAKVNAEFQEGVLKVHLGKSDGAKPKCIDIKVS